MNYRHISAGARSVKSERSQRPIWLGDDQRRWDHVRIHIQLLNDTRIDAYGLAVYMGLVSHAELNSGKCFPGLDLLADYACIHRKTAKKATEILYRAGYIDFINNAGDSIIPDPNKRTGKTHQYRILPPPDLPVEFDLSTRRAQSATSDIHSSRPDSLRSRSQSERSRPQRDEQESLNENQINKKGNSFPQGSSFQAPGNHSCSFCDDGWIVNDDGNAFRCPSAGGRKVTSR